MRERESRGGEWWVWSLRNCGGEDMIGGRVGGEGYWKGMGNGWLVEMGERMG